jgi:hypothetical protein
LRKSGAHVRANPIENSRFLWAEKSSRNFSARKHLFLTIPSTRVLHLIPNTTRWLQKGHLPVALRLESDMLLVSPLGTRTAQLHTPRSRTRLRLLPTRTVVCCLLVFVVVGWYLTLVPDRQIPSILSYVDGEEYNGQQAKQQLIRNSKNTVAYFRDYLGQE